MINFIKRWWSMILGIIVLGIPNICKEDIYVVNVICSVLATVLFSISICFDKNWKLKEELRLDNKEKLEKIQSILFVSVLLLLTVIGYLFKIEGFILFYARKNGFSVGIVPALASFFVVGAFTFFYKLRLRAKRDE